MEVEGPVVMLNLLRFRETADYSHAPELAPDSPISGQEAYRIYMEKTAPIIAKTGARVIFQGRPLRLLIGPRDKHWDWMLLVEQSSMDAFFGHVQNPEAMAVLPHRTAALIDSRIIPILPSE